MSTHAHRLRMIRTFVVLAVTLAILAPLSAIPQLAAVLPAPPTAAAQAAATGPQPGEVFLQFQDNASTETALCNSSEANCSGVASTQTRLATNVLLTNATRAEAVFEYWGGHPGTTDQSYRVNGGSWMPYPDIQNIPAGTLPTCYFRNPTNAIAAVPLTGSGGVRPPNNNNSTVTVSYDYRIGPQGTLQECAPGTNFYWGDMWVYEVSTRIYYDAAATAHPGGTITAPANGGSIGENPTITVSAQSSAGRTISRVDLIGSYLDYDWDGDGVQREWQYAQRRGVWERTIGTKTAPSSGSNTNGIYSFAWDTTWLPDQDQPIQLMARITDNAGYSYMTPVVSATMNRTSRSVRLYNTYNDHFGTRVFGPPRNFGVNEFSSPTTGKTTPISIPDPLTTATAARFILYSWSANPGNEDMNGDGFSDTDNARTEVWVNNREMWPSQRFGLFHNYSFDTRDFNDPRAFLNQGDNTLLIWSNRPNHKLEVLWPGPAIYVQFSAPLTSPVLSAANASLSTPEDQPLAITLPVSNPASAALSYSILTPPTIGTLSGDAPNLTYTPNANANGSDSFSFRVNDQYGHSATATVAINVQSVADVPQIVLGEGALLAPDGRFQRTATVTDPDSPNLSATVDYGDGTGPLPLAIGAGGALQLDYVYRDGGRFPLTITVSDGAQNGTASATVTVLTPGSPAPTGPWALTGWRYRFPVTANAGSYPRRNRVAEFDVNFTSALQQAGGSGPLIPESIRVVEVDDGGAVVDANVPYQFDPISSGYNASSNARGTLLVLMKNTTPANTSRRYQVYFETSGRFAAPAFTPMVAVTNPSLADYQRDQTAVIETRELDGTRNATYYYSRNGGGFISIFDRSNADWITYSTLADSQGSYRGLPNIGPVFHPGYYSTYPAGKGNVGGSLQRSTTTIVREGPLRTILRSVSSNGQWEATWEFFPTTARMTMVKAPSDLYWWLYEGTPGGVLESTDRWVRADGSSSVAYDSSYTYQERFHADIAGPEWVYFRAGESWLGGRAIWLANHDDGDQQMDMYRQQHDGGNTGAMTVFGFGRREYEDDGSQTLKPELQGTSKRFSLGFIESAPTSFDAATGQTIEGAYRDLGALTVGQGQRLLSNLAPWAPGETYRTRPDKALEVAAPGVLANDRDGDGDRISITANTQPLSGTLTFNAANGSFTYVPNEGFLGTDSFTYVATDGKNPAPPTTVTIRVSSNEAPVALTSSADANNLEPLTVAAPGVLAGATDVDGDPLTAVLIEPPFGGALELNADGSYTYTPNIDFSGVDTFKIAASDGEDQSEPVIVKIIVKQVGPLIRPRVYIPAIVR